MLGQLGDEWTLLVIQQALLGATRYGDFRTRLPISDAVLSSRLQSLVRDGLLVKQSYQTKPPRSEYLTTARSRSLWPVLVSIWDWERRWVPDHVDDLPAMRHVACGSDFAPQLACRACGDTVVDKDVVAQWGPSGSWARSVPATKTRRRSANDQRQAGLFPQTMSVLGNRWGFALLVAAFVGMSRFTDFQTQLAAPPGSIADRLSIFVANGVMETADNRYRLTEKGRALFPILITALHWAERWFLAAEGAAVVLTHRVCGERFAGALTCDQCAGWLRGSQVAPIQRLTLPSGPPSSLEADQIFPKMPSVSSFVLALGNGEC
ncbi:winged helix-turn-helix transcriptional regulator [Mycolicibacterium sp. 120270]|uniref:winged helix-turn-helix transcriptional regulator n=1 Tax=Mycolicibacterium sp. 120270 TaxID=3090600 RepID=UPI00299D5522|nr:winged helix-turn-helix transcriptional regulator [Mycolicibacterium sp. 120270]MDX1887893.1 winged helix-turn-helix transcriptional regulator [Mycolicibacterium sp. 120270]